MSELAAWVPDTVSEIIAVKDGVRPDVVMAAIASLASERDKPIVSKYDNDSIALEYYDKWVMFEPKLDGVAITTEDKEAAW